LTTSRAEELKILGFVQIEAGQKEEAITSLSRALDLDPTLADACYNRGLVRAELNQHRIALDDFDRALELGKTDPPVHAARGMALERLGDGPAADEAFRTAFENVESASMPDRVRMRCVYGFAVARRLPDAARRAFEEVLRDDAENARALYGLAMLAAPEDAPAALRFLVRALEADPNFAEARRYGAILRARTGELEQASREIAVCLEKEQFSGASVYAAACVIALAAERRDDGALRDQAVDLLKKAQARGVGLENASRDPDLAALRDHPGFRTLLGQSNAN
jgi:tetratricopeptide (TPR) repeat protein